MSTQVNWAKLVAQNRVKAIGIPWTEAELKAIREYQIDPELVRAGVLTPTDLPKEGEAVPVRKMKLAELKERARKIGLIFDDGTVTRADLILEIEQAEEQRDNADQTPPARTDSLSSENGSQGHEEPTA